MKSKNSKFRTNFITVFQAVSVIILILVAAFWGFYGDNERLTFSLGIAIIFCVLFSYMRISEKIDRGIKNLQEVFKGYQSSDNDKMNEEEHTERSEEGIKRGGKKVSIKTVAITFFGGLMLALLITCAYVRFYPGWIKFITEFPDGLGCIVLLSENNSNSIYYGYAIYAAIFLCAFIFRKRAFFITLLVFYIIVLCLNITFWLMMFSVPVG